MKISNLLIVFILAFISFIFWVCYLLQSENDGEEYLKDVTSELSSIFKKLDINNDGQLDITEFSALQRNHKILSHNYEDKEPLSYEVS